MYSSREDRRIEVMPEASSDPSPALLSYLGNARSSQRLINIPPFDRRSSREIDYVVLATSTHLEYAHTSFGDDAKWKSTSLFEIRSRKIFRFTEKISRTLFTLGKCPPQMYIPRILWEYFSSSRNRLVITFASSIVACLINVTRVYMCVCVYVYIYFFIYIYFWL